MRQTYRLPSGKETFGAKRYVKEWRDFAGPLCAALDAEIVAFDPCVTLAIKGRRTTVQLDRDMVTRLNAAFERAYQSGKEDGYEAADTPTFGDRYLRDDE